MANYIGSAKEVDHYIGNNLVVAKYIGENKYFDAYSEIEGNLPLTFKARVAHALTDYRIYGTENGAGVQTESGEPAGYKIPILNTSGEQQSNYDLFIGDSKLGAEEYLDYGEQKVYKRTPDIVSGIVKYRYITTQGVISPYNDYNVVYAPVIQGQKYVVETVQSITTIGVGWFEEIPQSGSQSYDSERHSYSSNSQITAPITGYIGITCARIYEQYKVHNNSTFISVTPPAPFPPISTYQGENTLSSEETVGEVSVKGRIREPDPLPEMTGIKAVFEYGGLSGTTWKNKVGANNFTWTSGNAPTDNGTEYVLSGNTFNKAGQYESNDDYSGAVTIYLLAKFETVKGGAAITVGGGDDEVRIYASNTYGDFATVSRDAYDMINPAVPANEYHVIAVTAASSDYRITVYGDGIKQEHTTPRTQLPSTYNGKATLYGRLPSTNSDGNMHIKFVAFGNEKHTEEQIVANSQFIMSKYGVS